MPLDKGLFNKVVKFLSRDMKSSEREALLIQAFYGTSLEDIDTEGTNKVFATRLVARADDYGTMAGENGEKALVHFLNIWMTLYGSDVQAEARALIQEIESSAAAPEIAVGARPPMPVTDQSVSAPPPVVATTAVPVTPAASSPEIKAENPGILVTVLRKMPFFRKWPDERLKILLKVIAMIATGLSVTTGFMIINVWVPQSNSLCGHPNFLTCGLYGPSAPKPADYTVVVAGFGLQMADGTIIRDERADEVSLSAAKALEDQLSFEDRVITIEDGTFDVYPLRSLAGKHIDPYIIAATPEARSEQAALLAASLNADIVVYGLIREENGTRRYAPEFYVADLQTDTSDVLQFKELDLLKREIVVSSSQASSIQTGDLTTRLNIIHSFVLAMSQYAPTNYANAVPHFEEAIQYAPNDPDMALLYVLAGNAAGRGIAESGNGMTQDQAVSILSYYKNALSLQPNYTRGLIGTGDTLTALSGAHGAFQYDSSVTLRPAVSCLNYTLATEVLNSGQLLAMLALNCYEKAINLTGSQTSTQAQEEYMRASMGAGTAQMMLSDTSAALDAYKQGVEVYELHGAAFGSQSDYSAGHLYARYARSRLLDTQNQLTCDARREIAEDFMQGFELLGSYGSYRAAAEDNCAALAADASCGDVSNLCQFTP
jgi:tetratricopeptide (TPR) repeat protein